MKAPEHPRAWRTAPHHGCGYGPVPRAFTGALPLQSRSRPQLPQTSITSIEKPLPIFPTTKAGLTMLIKVGGFPGRYPLSPRHLLPQGD